ncbi:MAG: 4-hydroxy-3-methylbut-2-enyl diphosphate reductase [Alphaproteobacteria bacterium]|nr:4-hydroxy-3-methylbut-2-enyl diphosphate reductase [Alphaproteobacteria bacterium]MDE2266405.1 4-hydroxy-3-methylbut-2-enyl diphosphate reductase [Alphaproteobacteria bacterium]MDE2500175.1 4-hydroxy-3-methylbut-2-enyl diphosphate reductase [Alphaproteobacteria bacterium]
MGSTEQNKAQRPQLKLLLAAPRGFCAGVERAIRIVELALAKFGAPVYVRHEIVHNRHVVERLEKMGAVFVDELDQVPDGAQVIFSAHGVPKAVPAEAKRRQLFYLNATCPLVSKVHVEAERHFAAGHHVILIGHAGHPEVEGTMGQLPDGAITLIENLADVEALAPADPSNLAFITQTTLSVDDTHELVAALRRRFPDIAGPHKEDICYATTNRQQAIKEIAHRAELVLIIGAPNSSNSVRLVEVALRAGAKHAVLIEHAKQIDWSLLDNVKTVALSASASAPETLVRDVIDAFRARYDLTVEETTVTREDVAFNLPRALAS